MKVIELLPLREQFYHFHARLLSQFQGEHCYHFHARLLSQLKLMGTPPCIFVIFTKGNNFSDFLFASLADIAFPNWGLLSKEKNLPFKSILSF